MQEPGTLKGRTRVALAGDYPPERRRLDGGVQAAFSYLVEELRCFQHLDIHVIAFRADCRTAHTVKGDGFLLHLLPKRPWGIPTLFFPARRDFRRCLLSIEPHLVHAQGAGMSGYVAVKSAWPTVVTFHGMLREDARFMSRFPDRLRLKLLSLLCEALCVKKAAHAILISPYVSRYFGKKLKGKAHHIPNPVSSDFFELPHSPERGRILFAGRVIPRKGILTLLSAARAAQAHVDLTVVLAGSLNDRSYVKTVRDYIAANRMEGYVTLSGLLDEEAVLKEFERCAILVLPSFQETAPMVIPQAMAAGKPVVATDTCGIPDQVDQDVTGLLFRPGDAEALSGHLVTLLTNERLRQEMGNMARRKAFREYHPERVARSTAAVYEEIAGASQRSEDGHGKRFSQDFGSV